MVKPRKPGLTTWKAWLVKPGKHPGLLYFNQAFGTRVSGYVRGNENAQYRDSSRYQIDTKFALKINVENVCNTTCVKMRHDIIRSIE